MDFFNLHTHSLFCDGKAEPEAYARKAIELGFHTLGFSGHSPLPFENKFAIKDDQALHDYFTEVRRLKEKYRHQIRILLSLEIDFVPGLTRDFNTYRELGNLDYVIGGVHLIRNRDSNNTDLWFIDGPFQEKYDEGLKNIFKGNPRKGVEAYYQQLQEMVETQQPDIIAHLDKIKMHNKDRFFSEHEGWYKDLVWKTLKLISNRSTSIVEVNTRGVYKKRTDTLFPGPEILEQVLHLNIPVTLNSDAHEPHELDGYYPEALAMLKDIGFRELTFYNGNERETMKIR